MGNILSTLDVVLICALAVMGVMVAFLSVMCMAMMARLQTAKDKIQDLSEVIELGDIDWRCSDG